MEPAVCFGASNTIVNDFIFSFLQERNFATDSQAGKRSNTQLVSLGVYR